MQLAINGFGPVGRELVRRQYFDIAAINEVSEHAIQEYNEEGGEARLEDKILVVDGQAIPWFSRTFTSYD